MAGVIIALDYPSAEEALALVDRLGERADFFKVGMELFCREGPAVVRALRERSKRVFLDVKLHDIPNTVVGAVSAAADAEVDLLTLHASGGRGMMAAAVEAAAGRVRLLGVTVLTSLTPSEIEGAWGRPVVSLRDDVIRLAGEALESGLDGVVASALEGTTLRRRYGSEFLLVTPGIRLAGGSTHDQVRVATPAAAAAAGADYLVVGRTVTAASDPLAALDAVRREMEVAAAAPGGAGMRREAAS